MAQTPFAIVRLTQTCGAYPSQWEGRTDDGDDIYIRYRHAEFSIRKGYDINCDCKLGDGDWEDAIIYKSEFVAPGGDSGRLDQADLPKFLPEWITLKEQR